MSFHASDFERQRPVLRVHATMARLGTFNSGR